MILSSRFSSKSLQTTLGARTGAQYLNKSKDKVAFDVAMMSCLLDQLRGDMASCPWVGEGVMGCMGDCMGDWGVRTATGLPEAEDSRLHNLCAALMAMLSSGVLMSCTYRLKR